MSALVTSNGKFPSLSLNRSSCLGGKSSHSLEPVMLADQLCDLNHMVELERAHYVCKSLPQYISMEGRPEREQIWHEVFGVPEGDSK